ncbi:unnamed protein product [Pleuronectes platessa]|uniref:Integrase core domain-containing protein n=1 Tax=Pleuronectes platessa TaxID=8262 RepID=A0A9N7ULN2_PLEPL|nr:unnamed protein product [Pleuronectes platessa]
MYTKCRECGLRVRKEDVRLALKELDRRGVALRKAGRLRRRRYFSKGPNFIWHMDSYDKLKPYGFCINGSIDDGTADSYLEGASTANQRIEYWWNFLHSQCVEFWFSFFADLRDNGFFDAGFLDKAILQFCCMGLIQDELDDTAQVWNAHTIRPSKNTNVPSGRPNVMYALPQLYGTRDFLCSM